MLSRVLSCPGRCRFLSLTIVSRSGGKIPVPFNDGDRLFDAIDPTPAKELQGPCGGNCACGGCHCILDAKNYKKPEEAEVETLENSQGKTATSRLACQLILTPDFDGAVIKMGPL
jgi:2Fe-2S ferredoxin